MLMGMRHGRTTVSMGHEFNRMAAMAVKQLLALELPDMLVRMLTAKL